MSLTLINKVIVGSMLKIKTIVKFIAKCNVKLARHSQFRTVTNVLIIIILIIKMGIVNCNPNLQWQSYFTQF
mgnify:CR=1 FL=1